MEKDRLNPIEEGALLAVLDNQDPCDIDEDLLERLQSVFTPSLTDMDDRKRRTFLMHIDNMFAELKPLLEIEGLACSPTVLALVSDFFIRGYEAGRTLQTPMTPDKG